MPAYSITWRSSKDDRTCPICRAIDGYTWTGTGIPPDDLVHPTYGEVWNKYLGSLAHEKNLAILSGHKVSHVHGLMSNCRCSIEIHVDASDVLAKLIEFKNKLEVAINQ